MPGGAGCLRVTPRCSGCELWSVCPGSSTSELSQTVPSVSLQVAPCPSSRAPGRRTGRTWLTSQTQVNAGPPQAPVPFHAGHLAREALVVINFKRETQKKNKNQELLQRLGDPGVPRCSGDISLVRCQLQGLGLRGQALQASELGKLLWHQAPAVW